MSVEIRVTGLAELRAALERIRPEVAPEVKQANREAAERIRALAKSKASSLGGVAAKSAVSLVAAYGANWAGITIDGYSYPYALGAEFGGRGRPTTQQFKPWLGTTGYFLYPTIREHAEDILEPYENALERLIRKGFPN